MNKASVLVACALCVSLSACASEGSDAADAGTIDVRISDGFQVPSTDVDVYLDEDDNETVIRGRIYGGGGFLSRYGTHVHVLVTSPDGQVIADEAPYVMRRVKLLKYGWAGSRFTVRVPELVPPGTVVDVVYHDADHRGATEEMKRL
jgi:hypothetical protein